MPYLLASESRASKVNWYTSTVVNTWIEMGGDNQRGSVGSRVGYADLLATLVWGSVEPCATTKYRVLLLPHCLCFFLDSKILRKKIILGGGGESNIPT
jgi:hypothetical protein